MGQTSIGARLLLVCALVSACPPSRAAIQVTIEVDAAVKSTCFTVVARGADGTESASAPVARKERLVVAVYSSDKLDGEVTLTARGFVGNGCEAPQVLNDESEPATGAFVKDVVSTVTLVVSAPAPALDADRDGYRASLKDGPDCADGNAAIHPGATEACTDGVDNDCDLLTDCAAPTCEGSTCNDGMLCTTQDRCQQGACRGTAVQCAPGSGQCAATGVCNPATGACVFTRVDAGTSCDDGNPCTGPDVCLVDGGCAAQTTLACATPPGPCFAAVGVCLGDAGCVYAPLDAGAVCNDGNACTTSDRCTATGSCAGTAVTCAAAPGQCFATFGTCNPGDGGCTYQVSTGAACSDSNTCTLGDSCQADGGCAGTAFSCTTPPNGCFNAAGACLTDGGCSYPARTVGAACDDGNLCTTNDACSATQTCDAIARSCNTPPSACFSAGACDVDAGCVYSLSPGAACSDSDPCTTGESCLADGGCAGGSTYSCTTPPSSCFAPSGACQGDGGCSYTVGPLFQACDGGACRADGGCTPPSFPYTPSNFNPAVVAAGGLVGSVTLNCAAVFDSSPDASTPFVTWCNQPQPNVVTVAQDGGPDVVVLGMYGLDVTAAGSLRVLGSRPVVFAVFDTATLAGPVQANAQLDVAGAGGSTALCGASTGGAGTTSSGRGGGGGGGGFGTTGANGGQGNNSGATIGAAGAAFGAATLTPLRAGCSGGPGGGTLAGVGGAGGGALQFSVAGSLRVSNVVTASGGGGRQATNNSSGGGGGGSGGAVLLEAASLTVTSAGRLTANGGGAGEGADQGTQGEIGANGATTSATPAAGGNTNNAGNGGNGGAGSTAPTLGGNDNRGGGGGGGAVGRIRVNAFGACSIDPAAIVSPAASRSGCP